MENSHAESNYLEGFSTNELNYPIANKELRLRKNSDRASDRI